MTRKIDGWCAWHPEYGLSDTSFALSEERAWYEHVCTHEVLMKNAEVRPDFINEEIRRSKRVGWQIKPIHIVDASEDSEEVVVRKEVWKKLMEWCSTVHDELRYHFEDDRTIEHYGEWVSEFEKILEELKK